MITGIWKKKKKIMLSLIEFLQLLESKFWILKIYD
jgi:hypothetical protein